MRVSPRTALAALVVLTASACGSTVSLTGVVSRTGGSGLGLTDQVATSDSATVLAGETATSGALPSSQGRSEEEVGSESGANDPSGSAERSSTSISSASTTVEVGIPVGDTGASNAVLGSVGTGLQQADPKPMYEGYIAALNKRGGILGRKLVPVFYKLPANSDFSTLAQKVCTYFTQDHKVSWVLVSDVANLLYPCLHSKGVATLSTGPVETSTPVLRRTPLAQLPETIAMDRMFSMLVERYVRMSYFSTKPTDKIGVLHYDHQSSMDGFKALQAGLAEHNLRIADSYSITAAQSADELVGMEAAVKNAELRFSAEGITHVMCVESNAFLCGFFGLYAGQQGYYPRYAWSSAQPLTNVTANLTPRSLKGSVFVGWRPVQDLQNEGEMPKALQKCFAFFRKMGVEISTGNEHEQAAGVCDDIDFLTAALTKSATFTARGLLAGARQLKGVFLPSNSFGIDPAAHVDAVSVVRDGVYVESCDCFRYTTQPGRIS